MDIHDLVQQMLNPLVNNTDATPAPATLFLDLPADVPQVTKEDEAQQKLPPLPRKEWTDTVYTF